MRFGELKKTGKNKQEPFFTSEDVFICMDGHLARNSSSITKLPQLAVEGHSGTGKLFGAKAFLRVRLLYLLAVNSTIQLFGFL